METIAKSLATHPFFEGLAEAGLVPFASCAREVTVRAGGYVFREGGEADSLYLLGSGRVNLEIVVPPRGPLAIETLEGGDILGLSWLFPPYRWHLDARAVEDVSAVALDARCLRTRLDENPERGYLVLKKLVGQLYERLERVRLQRLDVYRTAS